MIFIEIIPNLYIGDQEVIKIINKYKRIKRNFGDI